VSREDTAFRDSIKRAVVHFSHPVDLAETDLLICPHLGGMPITWAVAERVDGGDSIPADKALDPSMGQRCSHSKWV